MGHFIGHEGKGSILSYLKNRGWVNYLHAGVDGATGFSFAKFTVDLTPDGLGACSGLDYTHVLIA